MVENVANFTFTTQNKPSIFDIIAQKSLNDTLHPGLQKIALILATNFPKKFNWLIEYYDESFLIFNSLLQLHYLKYYDATFSENFYGLRRVFVDNKELSAYYKDFSFLFVVIIPYFKRKFDEKIALYKLERADGCLRDNFEGNWKKFLIYLHNSFEIIWNLFTVISFLKYMSGSNQSQLPLLRLIGLKLIYNSQIEDENSGIWLNLFKGQFSLGLIKASMTSLLELTAFLLQFLQTWNTKKSNFSLTALPNVQPPNCDTKAKNYQGKCPICLKQWRIPTVLPISGFVFCFACILRYLRDHQKCPITNLPAKPLDIIRLYDD